MKLLSMRRISVRRGIPHLTYLRLLLLLHCTTRRRERDPIRLEVPLTPLAKTRVDVKEPEREVQVTLQAVIGEPRIDPLGTSRAIGADHLPGEGKIVPRQGVTLIVTLLLQTLPTSETMGQARAVAPLGEAALTTVFRI
jgi:hypothetical protein